MKTYFVLFFLCLALFLNGCAANIKLFSDAKDPLTEVVLEGEKKEKILIIPVQGIISDQPKERFLGSQPSMVQEVVSMLEIAEQDQKIKAVVLTVNSPGGTATASDILYHELLSFKERTGICVVAAFMDIAASGGYYISLPADMIVAHPTTVTGSVGVIYMRPELYELFGKLGVGVDVKKSGENKDIGSPFRPMSEEEQMILQNLTDGLGKRFLSLVSQHRKISPENLETVATARVFLAQEAQTHGLVDKIGYLDDALDSARQLAGLSDECQVVIYRRSDYANDNIYNPVTMQGGVKPFLVNVDLLGKTGSLSPGFYYVWSPAVY